MLPRGTSAYCADGIKLRSNSVPKQQREDANTCVCIEPLDVKLRDHPLSYTSLWQFALPRSEWPSLQEVLGNFILRT